MITITWALNELHSFAGSFLTSEPTNPLFKSLTATPFTLKPTLSPGIAYGWSSWCISIDFTSVAIPEGAN